MLLTASHCTAELGTVTYDQRGVYYQPKVGINYRIGVENQDPGYKYLLDEQCPSNVRCRKSDVALIWLDYENLVHGAPEGARVAKTYAKVIESPGYWQGVWWDSPLAFPQAGWDEKWIGMNTGFNSGRISHTCVFAQPSDAVALKLGYTCQYRVDTTNTIDNGDSGGPVIDYRAELDGWNSSRRMIEGIISASGGTRGLYFSHFAYVRWELGGTWSGPEY